MRQEHNQAHRTPPVPPHSGSLCAPSSRVPKPRFSAPETVRAPWRTESSSWLARAGPFGTPYRFCFFGFCACVLCFFLSSLRVVRRLAGTASPSASSFCRKAYHLKNEKTENRAGNTGIFRPSENQIRNLESQSSCTQKGPTTGAHTTYLISILHTGAYNGACPPERGGRRSPLVKTDRAPQTAPTATRQPNPTQPHPTLPNPKRQSNPTQPIPTHTQIKPKPKQRTPKCGLKDRTDSTNQPHPTQTNPTQPNPAHNPPKCCPERPHPAHATNLVTRPYATLPTATQPPTHRPVNSQPNSVSLQYQRDNSRRDIRPADLLGGVFPRILSDPVCILA